MSKKTSYYGCVAHIVILWRFLSIMLCLNLMTMQAKWRYHALTQGIRAIGPFTEYRKYYCWSIYDNAKSSVECWDHCDKIKPNQTNTITSLAAFQVSKMRLTTFLAQLFSTSRAKVVIRGEIMFFNFLALFSKCSFLKLWHIFLT